MSSSSDVLPISIGLGLSDGTCDKGSTNPRPMASENQDQIPALAVKQVGLGLGLSQVGRKPVKGPKRQRKKGIIYLSTIPPFMTVTKLIELMSQYGEVGRVFLQPASSKKTRGKLKKKAAIRFSEGWVEFLSKRIAKEVAGTLNNTRIGGRKKSRYYDHIWNLKYLSRFKWVHLSERLEYERAVFKQKMRAEIAQAKRESNHFAHNVDLSERLKKAISSQKTNSTTTVNIVTMYKQRQTDEEIRKNNKQPNKENRTEFLKNLFAK